MIKKKILILSIGYFPNLAGGAEVAIREITDRLSERFDFEMITLRFDSNLPREEKVGKVLVHRIGFALRAPSAEKLVRFPLYLNKILFPVLAAIKFLRLNREKHFDAIWAMMAYMGMSAALINFFKKVPILLTIQEGDDLKQITGRARIKPFVFLIKKAFREAVGVQAISRFLSDWSRVMGAKNVVTIPNGVNLERFKVGPGNVSPALRVKLGIRPEDIALITVSRLVLKNGVDILIRSLAFLPENIKLLIAGSGPDEEKLRSLADKLKLAQRVIFAGYVTQAELPDYLTAADIFGRPSRTEGQGIAFLEAMAVGVPIIATAVGGIPDMIEDKKTGLICQAEDPEDFARKVNIILRDEEIKINLIQNGLKLVESYDWANIVKRLDDEFFSLI